MKSYQYTGWLALALAANFMVHSFILIGLEPGLGFQDVMDYFDATRLIPAFSSPAWLVNDIFHLLLGLLIPVFGHYWQKTYQTSRLAVILSSLCGPLFLIVGAAGITGFQLTNILSGQVEKLDQTAIGLMVFLSSVLVAAVIAFGWLVLWISVSSWRDRILPTWLNILGIVVWLSTVATVVIPLPVPVFFATWAFILGLYLLSFSKWHPEKGPEAI